MFFMKYERATSKCRPISNTIFLFLFDTVSQYDQQNLTPRLSIAKEIVNVNKSCVLNFFFDFLRQHLLGYFFGPYA